MKAVKVVLAVGIILGIVFTFAQGGARKEASYQTCMQTYTKRSGNMIADIISPARYCGCVAENVDQDKEVTFADLQPCMDEHIKPGILGTCTESVHARLRDEAGLALDCSCMYDQITKLMWQFYDAQLVSVSAQDKNRIASEVLKVCTKEIALSGQD